MIYTTAITKYKLLFCFFIVLLYISPAFSDTSQKKLKIGSLPTTSSLLLHVAVDEGLFSAHGLDVEIVPFRSTIEITSAMRAGALDGHFTDIITVLMQNETGIPQKIVVNALCSTPKTRNFGIAVSPNSSIQKIDELKEHSVAISKATIVDFLFTNFLKKVHLSQLDYKTIDINRLVIRMQMLLSNKVDAALLVEPLLTLVETKGGRVIIDDSSLENFVLAVISLTHKNTKPEIARPFRKAILKAAALINTDPEKYRKTLLEKGIINKEIVNIFSMPIFNIENKPIPTPSDIELFTLWMLPLGYLHTQPQYTDVVLE